MGHDQVVARANSADESLVAQWLKERYQPSLMSWYELPEQVRLKWTDEARDLLEFLGDWRSKP